MIEIRELVTRTAPLILRDRWRKPPEIGKPQRGVLYELELRYRLDGPGVQKTIGLGVWIIVTQTHQVFYYYGPLSHQSPNPDRFRFSSGHDEGWKTDGFRFIYDFENQLFRELGVEGPWDARDRGLNIMRSTAFGTFSPALVDLEIRQDGRDRFISSVSFYGDGYVY